MQAPPTSSRRTLSDSDSQLVKSALGAARRGDVNATRTAIASMTDPLARKIGTWALADTSGGSLSFFELDQARRDLAGWPRGARRDQNAERKLETAGLSPAQVIAWFGGGEPQTPEGAMALASAYRMTGKPEEAATLIRRFWRDKIFEASAQQTMLARFSDVLTQQDHIRRADILLLGAQGPAAQNMVALLPPDQQLLARARMAFRANAANANDLAAALPASVAGSPGLAFEKAAYMRRKGLTDLAIGMTPSFPEQLPSAEAGERIWSERYQLVLAALRSGNVRGAYNAAANTGLSSGGAAADAEFYAGWIALQKLRNPNLADKHFANLERIGSSPITRGRALYWRGRAAEASGDSVEAHRFYGLAAVYNTTFYGLLAGEKIGDGRLVLAPDPQITEADRARFESRDSVQAARVLNEIGEIDLFRAFVLALDDILPTVQEQAMLVDLARGYGDQDTSMKVVRTAAQRGFLLADRGYPHRTPPAVERAPEPALVLGITRQESGFDPRIRSPVGARGMMQLMPTTAQHVARQLGVGYSPGQLDEPDYNMRLGSNYLGQMIDTFSGSYVMAIAAYNAGPGRPPQWAAFCGDPRGGTTDPIDFIECIPFSETRNYVMRVMEGMQVYRAKLNGGSVPITLSSDLRRGGYAYARPTASLGSP
jgi:soluble lytic murein transglycosylase